MPLFDYAGQLESGRVFRGTLEADSHDRARATLTDMGVRVTDLRPTGQLAFVAPLSLTDFQYLNEQIAMMTEAGVPLEQGLRQLAADVARGRLKRVLLDLANTLAGGASLEEAIQRMGARFPAHYAGAVQAGARTGDLGATLYALAAELRIRGYSGRALLELAAYPLVVLTIALAVLSFMLRVLVPTIQELILDTYGDWDGVGVTLGSLSGPTASIGPVGRALFAFAGYWNVVEITLWISLGLVALLVISSLTPFGRAFRETLLGYVPGFRQVFRYGALARFAHTTALGAYSGLPLHELVRAGGAASGSRRLARDAAAAAARLEQGDSIAAAIGPESSIPGLWSTVVTTTAQRGELPAGLSELAKSYEARSEYWSRTLRVILGPALLLFVATFIGTVIAMIGGAMAEVIQRITT